eukprot:jgi/Psemu1/9470/gm1.9470_g
MTTTTNSAQKRGANPHSTNKRTKEKKGRLKNPPPNSLDKHDDDQNKHRFAVYRNLKAALKNESYGTDELVKNLSLKVATCFTALTTKARFQEVHIYYVSGKEEGEGNKEKSDTTFSDLGPIPHQIDVMVDFFLYELDNGVTGVLGLLSSKQISEQFKNYDMRNKWYNFESWLRNVYDKSGVDSLYGRNVVNYDTIKKYMLMYREILYWYMKNVQYPPGADYTSEAFCFHTKGQNCSPRASKQYVKSMKNFLDCLMAQSSLRVSMSHSYNQVDLDNHLKKQRKSKPIFTTICLSHLNIKLLTHQDFYQYFLPELIQNSLLMRTTVLSGEKWVPVGFHRQGDTNIAETGKVLLPLHSPLVFHYVINYKDTLSNYYNIHFEIDDDRVTLSPCKLGTGKIGLAHFNVTKGILYLVKQWLITKFVDHGTNLGVNVVLSLKTAFGGVDSSFDCSIDNVCKKIIQKVFKSPHKGCFGYDHVMETIEGLVLTERTFLKGAMTQFAHVNFEDRPEQLVTGILELSGLEDKHNNQTCVTRFLQYDVNSQQEVHQQIFMEHIPYVFREIFVIDPEVVERHTWVEELIHYSYLPEMGTIFTPLTEKLARYLLEKSDDLLSANLVVQFLDDNVVNNYGKGTGQLNPGFKHLQGRDFVFHKPFDLQTWDCFKTSKRGFVPPWVVQVDGGNVAKRKHLNKGKKNDPGSTVTGECSKKKANKSKQSGIDTTKGNSKDAGLTAKRSKTGEKEGSNKREEEVRDVAKTAINVVVTLSKFPLKINGGPPTQFFGLSVVLKEPDSELMYPIYKVNEQVCYTARRNSPILIGEDSRYLHSAYEQYERLPGYYLIFKKGKAGQHPCGDHTFRFHV